VTDATQTDVTQNEDAPNLSGRALVRAVLIAPLAQAGLRRAPGVSLGDHDAFLQRLTERLAYLDTPALTVLAELVLDIAEGKLHNQWPSFATIWNTCQRVQRMPPPDEERHIMTTWLRSRGGPVAQQGGYLVELHGHLARRGTPPNDYELSKIKERAADNARQLARWSQKAAEGTASPDELNWLDRYTRQTLYCQQLVAGGERARADQVAADRGPAGAGDQAA
jgi:hypothetical protein